MTSYLPDNVPYDSSQHHDLEWIQTSIRTIVGLYEYWYTVALFGACIYILMLIFYISDVPSYASSERAVLKNAKKIDRKENRWHCVFDRKLHEMGAIEGTRSYTGVHDKKISKYFKLPKTSRDMLVIAVDYHE